MAATQYAKDKIKEFLWHLGLRDTLPASAINRTPIAENNNPLVNIKEDTSFLFATALQSQNKIYLRQTVYNKLKQVQSLLPANYYLKIYSAFRSIEEQQQRWEKKLAYNRRTYIHISQTELENLTRSQVADPRKGFGGHQTGGAIDLTLCHKDGTEYDMGTKYSENTPNIKTNCKKLAITQRKNREILRMCMTKAGFINYPNEWWHYSYGDRMWAAYTKQKNCFYGLAKTVEK